MRSGVLQFLLAGALVVAWIWMLGRPLLTRLARRARRDTVGHFRYQQAAIGRTVAQEPPEGLSSSLLRPVTEWRAQAVERRRLQLLLGAALATFASALLAIALRGSFVRLFLVMTIGFTAHVLVAAWIGARELRIREAELRRRTIDAAAGRSVGRSVIAREAEPPVADDDPYGIDDLLTGDGLGGGLFDEGFFEPIPELDPGADADRGSGDPVDDGVDDRSDATFTTPVTPRPRPGRPPKGRPIYVEPEPGAEEGDGAIRAVND